MNEPTALLVPVQVDALVVNDQVRIGENFQRWQPNYALLRHRLSPEPPPFAGIDTEFAVRPERSGVYLQWQLPQALIHGCQENPEADITFPLVPNRWLVVRTHGPSAGGIRERTAWIVESDHLDPATGTSPYVTRDGQITRIGRRIALADEPWSEPEAPAGELFLTVIGPGLATFAAYQPYNTNVFSLHDTMDGLDDDREHAVSYFVAGWYSDTSADPVTGLTTEQLKTLLTTHDWTVAEDQDGPATRLLCHGTVLGLTWHRTGPMPSSPRPDVVNAAVGNTTAHATGALPQETEPGDDARGPWSAAALLGALQHGMLDDAESPFAQARRAFAAWFTPAPAGYTWHLEEDPHAPRASRRERRAARRSLTGLLDRLNRAQAVHDAAAQDLATARRRLYDLWWAQGMPETPMLLPGGNQQDPDAYREQLNQQLAAAEQEATACEEALRQARALIPWGMTPDKLAADIQEYLGDAAPGFVLKRAPLPDYHRPNEPVVILRGTQADQQIRSKADEALRCRRPAELVTGVYLDAGRTHLAAAPASAVPLPPNLPHSPEELRPLLAEFFHLDPAGAAELAAATAVPEELLEDLRAAMTAPQRQARGVAPAHGTAPWSQPWSPLFFQWEVDYYPIALAEPDSAQAPENANWVFDGYRYRWPRRRGVGEAITLRGRQFLTPTPSQQQEGRLRQYAADRSGPYREQLMALAALAGEGDLIAQTLDGFQDQLSARSVNNALETDGSSRVRSAAVAEQAALIRPPDLGSLPHPFVLWPTSRFQEIRSGQFAFHRLSIVDRFGRALPVVVPDEIQLRESIGNGTPAHAFRPWIADELCPGLDENGHPITVVTQDAGRFVEVKPRLPQPARTRLYPVSATDDDTPAEGDHAGAALCGWLIPNYLDRTLLCYGPDGAALGAVDTAVTTGGVTRLAWLPLPGSPYEQHEDLAEDHRHLHDLVATLLERDPRTLVTLLRALDRTLTTIAPNGDQTPGTTLGRLLGRPLALVRACARIDLDGPARYDPSWRNLLDPAPPALLGYRWPVRLGECDDLDDGLLGHFLERDYGTLHTVLADEDLSDLDDPDGYLRPIAAGYGLALPARAPRDHDTASSARLTLLVDPYGAVHATTGILPTAHLQLPGRVFEEPLEALAAAFRFGPMPLLPVPGNESPALPRPSDRHGTWSWQQRSPAGTWQELPTRPSTPEPHFPLPSPQLRTGWLQLHPAEPEEDHA
ncbi:hypothetical protein [Streptomyces sp. NPDC048516]|uniref:hypothetical protein n=1 Tax=Streptomyces sp. NPDC048516 TaxID=3365565 RepID=UPI00372492CE